MNDEYITEQSLKQNRILKWYNLLKLETNNSKKVLTKKRLSKYGEVLNLES